MTQLKRNILASYISQIYLVLISILILPMYIKYMGAEAYGLVGFFAMLQGLFVLLDFGLTPTISRQTAQYNAGVATALKFRQLFRSLSIIFCGIALLGGGALFLSDHYIATHWLKLQSLQLSEVLFCLQIMAISISLRWMTGLYRGVISGFEKIVWLSLVNMLIATLRFPGVLLYMYYFGYTLTTFFIYQLVVAAIEFIILLIQALRLLPKTNGIIGWSLKPVKPLLGFALTIAFTSSVWVLLTQLDKLVLSGILSLSDYGYFTLAVLVAGGVLQISAPISSVIMPRMARLYGEQKNEELKSVYLNATQFVAVIAVTAGIVLAALANPVLYVWTGDVILAKKTALILQLYALGNALLALAAFPYYLQYAKGSLKYHFIGNLVCVILLVPTIIWAAKNYGAIGAGWVWFIVQLLYLLFWVSYVHMKIEPNINIQWFKAFAPTLISVTVTAYILAYLFSFSDDRLIAFMQIATISGICLAMAILSSHDVRNLIKSKLFKRVL